MKTQKTVNIIDRTEIKRTGVVLYEIVSSNGVDKYFATYQDGEVYCECPGFNGKYHKCYHTDYIEQVELNGTFDIQSAADEIVEQAENAVLDAAYEVRAQEIASHKQYATCQYCGRYHNSSTCNL